MTEDDRSDEKRFLPTCDKATEFACGSDPSLPSRCVPRSNVNDGFQDCADGSDELMKSSMTCLPSVEFECATSARCILRRYVNDGHPDCSDGSDENVADHTCFADTEFSCGGGGDGKSHKRCIPRSWVGNRMNDCGDGSDEKIDRFACLPGEHACADGSRCLPPHMVCDGVQNCADGSDETEFSCGDAPAMARCKPNGTELFPWSQLLFETFSRSDGSFIYAYCTQGIELERQSSLRKGFKCLALYYDTMALDPDDVKKATERRRIVPQLYLKNNMSVCYNREDVCYDQNNEFNCSRCIDGAVISPTQLCDGIVDCEDLSDECTCQKSPVKPLCDIAYPQTGKQRVEFGKVCDAVADMEDELDEQFCDQQVLSFLNQEEKAAAAIVEDADRERVFCKRPDDGSAVGESSFCDGTVDCPSKTDECTAECFLKVSINDPKQLHTTTNRLDRFFQNCFNFSHWKDGIVQYNITIFRGRESISHKNSSSSKLCWARIGRMHGYSDNNRVQVFCKGEMTSYGIFKDMNYLCEYDGVECPWIHVCVLDRQQKISKDKVCDFAVDCSDGSDEADCPSTHFYCTNRNPPFVPIEKKQDGVSDCSDRSDECFESEISSSTQMIKSRPLRIYVWVSASLILVSNAVAFSKLIKAMRGVRSKRAAAFFNTFALINLSASDTIFAVVLLLIGVKSEQFSGSYCTDDLQWRTSTWCTMIGTLTVVSSQTSINMLVVMTAVRLYVTYKPFMAKRMSVKVIYTCSALAWLISIFIALLPLFLHQHFVHSFYIEQNSFLSDQFIPVSELNRYIDRNIAILSGSTTNESVTFSRNVSALNSWYFGTKKGRSKFPTRHVTVKGSFGYYSTSSVCFPNFYSWESNTAKYSLAIIVYNLFCLLVITLGYFLIFRALGRSKQRVGVVDVQSSKTMKHIAYIIFTDAVCWLPIIIMSFMSYGSYKLPEIAHALSTIVFLPINSFLNPVIYSRVDGHILIFINKFKSRIYDPRNSRT